MDIRDNRTTKRIFKLFFAWGEEKEEKWLEERSLKGWHLYRVGFLNYKFVKGLPKRFIYKFDFRLFSRKSEDEYLAIFKDAGWELIDIFASWYYFRIDPEVHGESEFDIYNDNLSRIKKYQRILLFILIVNGPALYFLIPYLIEKTFAAQSTPYTVLYAIILVLIALIESFLIYAVIRFIILIRRLRNNIRQ